MSYQIGTLYQIGLRPVGKQYWCWTPVLAAMLPEKQRRGWDTGEPPLSIRFTLDIGVARLLPLDIDWSSFDVRYEPEMLGNGLKQPIEVHNCRPTGDVELKLWSTDTTETREIYAVAYP